METESLNDFSGGFVESEHPAAFREGQWRKLDGFVFDSPNRLRSQWPIARIDEDGELWECGLLGGDNHYLIALDKATGNVKSRRIEPKWVWDPGAGTSDITDSSHIFQDWEDIATSDDSFVNIASSLSLSTVSSAGYPYLMGNVSLSGEYSTLSNGLLLRDGVGSTGNYYLVWGANDAIQLPFGFPETTADTDLPSGTVVGQWGDFTIWGDVMWYDDPESPSSTSLTRWGNAMWFSQPAQFDKYDAQDVIFLPHKGKRPQVQDMHELQQGLLVLTDVGIYFLRGTADDFVIEVVSDQGVGLNSRNGAAYFEPLEAVVWCDRLGRVWASDGTGMIRLDTNLTERHGFEEGLLHRDDDRITDGPNTHRWAPSVAVVGDTLLLSRSFGHELLCFQLTERDRGVWTKVKLPDFDSSGDDDWAPIFLRAAPDIGGVFLVHQATTSSTANRLVWIDVENHTRLNRGNYYWWDSVAGAQQEASLDLTIGTPVLATGSGHERAWWHRVGVRLGKTEDADAQLVGISQWTTGGDTDDRADGTFEDALASTDLDDGLAFPTALHTNVVHRKHVVVPGIGPSRQYRAEFVFNGDVTVEGVTVWADGAADDRGRHPEQAGTATTV